MEEAGESDLGSDKMDEDLILSFLRITPLPVLAADKAGVLGDKGVHCQA